MKQERVLTLEELDRRFAAACMHYEITQEKIGGRLFVDSGREQPIKIVTIGRDKMPVAMPVKDALIAQMKERAIDVLYIDPFITCHSVPENDNDQVNAVIDAWRDVANEANAAIELIHHANKAGQGDKITDGRGASSFVDGIRAGRVLAPLSKEDCDGMGLAPDEGARITVVRNGAKPNMQRRSVGLDYFRMESVQLGNGTPEYPDGDNIGVATMWKPPDAFDGVTLNDLARVQDAINACEEPPAENSQNHDWAGYVVAAALGLDIGEPGSVKRDRTHEQELDRRKVMTMLAAWRKSGALEVEEIRSSRNGRDIKVIVVGEPAVDLSEFTP